jgi:hypothetical protein
MIRRSAVFCVFCCACIVGGKSELSVTCDNPPCQIPGFTGATGSTGQGVLPAIAESAVITLDRMSAEADGVAAITASVTLTDAHGGVPATATVTLNVSGEAAPRTAMTDATGTARFALVSTAVTQLSLAFLLDAVGIGMRTVAFTAPIADATRSTVVFSRTSNVLADTLDFTEASVVLRSASGGVPFGAMVTMTSAEGGTLSDTKAIDEHGEAKLQLRARTSGAKTVSVHAGGVVLSDQPVVTFTKASVLLAGLTAMLDKTTATADTVDGVTLTITVPTVTGVPSHDLAIVVSSTGTGNVIDDVTAPDDTASARLRVRSSKAEAKTLSFTIDGVSGPTGLPLGATFVPGPPSALTSTFTIARSSISPALMTDGTVSCLDAQGNVRAGDTAYVTTTCGAPCDPNTLAVYQYGAAYVDGFPPMQPTNANGKARFTIMSLISVPPDSDPFATYTLSVTCAGVGIGQGTVALRSAWVKRAQTKSVGNPIVNRANPSQILTSGFYVSNDGGATYTYDATGMTAGACNMGYFSLGGSSRVWTVCDTDLWYRDFGGSWVRPTSSTFGSSLTSITPDAGDPNRVFVMRTPGGGVGGVRDHDVVLETYETSGTWSAASPAPHSFFSATPDGFEGNLRPFVVGTDEGQPGRFDFYITGTDSPNYYAHSGIQRWNGTTYESLYAGYGWLGLPSPFVPYTFYPARSANQFFYVNIANSMLFASWTGASLSTTTTFPAGTTYPQQNAALNGTFQIGHPGGSHWGELQHYAGSWVNDGWVPPGVSTFINVGSIFAMDRFRRDYSSNVVTLQVPPFFPPTGHLFTTATTVGFAADGVMQADLAALPMRATPFGPEAITTDGTMAAWYDGSSVHEVVLAPSTLTASVVGGGSGALFRQGSTLYFTGSTGVRRRDPGGWTTIAPSPPGMCVTSSGGAVDSSSVYLASTTPGTFCVSTGGGAWGTTAATGLTDVSVRFERDTRDPDTFIAWATPPGCGVVRKPAGSSSWSAFNDVCLGDAVASFADVAAPDFVAYRRDTFESAIVGPSGAPSFGGCTPLPGITGRTGPIGPTGANGVALIRTHPIDGSFYLHDGVDIIYSSQTGCQ